MTRLPLLRAFIGLGSNLGDRSQQLGEAMHRLTAEAVRITRSSSWYETQPIGPVTNQPEFLNAVVEVEFAGKPIDLLRCCLNVEQAMGRLRPISKGPRCIDLDLLLAGNVVMNTNALTLPHPGLTTRAFVLVPLLELEPDIVDPRDGQLLSRYLDRIAQDQVVRRVSEPC